MPSTVLCSPPVRWSHRNKCSHSLQDLPLFHKNYMATGSWWSALLRAVLLMPSLQIQSVSVRKYHRRIQPSDQRPAVFSYHLQDIQWKNYPPPPLWLRRYLPCWHARGNTGVPLSHPRPASTLWMSGTCFSYCQFQLHMESVPAYRLKLLFWHVPRLHW